MSTSRRKFLQAGSVFAASALLPMSLTTLAAERRTTALTGGIAAPKLPYRSRLDPVFYLNEASFSPHLNTTFALRPTGGARAVKLKLAQVKNLLPTAKAGAGGDFFSLLFEGSAQTRLEQDICRITHASLGTFTLLVVPIVAPPDTNKNSRFYEAIFDRRTS